MKRWRGALRLGQPFGEHAVRVWTVIAGFAAVAALVVSFIQLRGSPAPEGPPPVPETALSVVDLAVHRPSEVDADRSSDDEPTKKIKLDTVAVDVSVKNAGRTTAHIDKA